MKKITLLAFSLFIIGSTFSQVTLWSSDSSDYSEWSSEDGDGDDDGWGPYNTENSPTLLQIGFSSGIVFGSSSYNPNVIVTPDNRLYTPAIEIPENATEITYSMKVASSYYPDYAEHYAVYVYDDAGDPNFDNNIFEETLTDGGDGTAYTINTEIPDSFAGKTVKLIIRHYDCSNQDTFLVDDFNITYKEALSVEKNALEVSSVYPNPVKDILKIETLETIESISVSNQLGQEVKKFDSNSIINNSINLGELKKGFYIINVIADNKSKTLKIVKE